MLLGVVALIFVGLVGMVGMVAAETLGGADPDAIEPIVQLFGLVFGWLYFAGMESSAKQGTLGKLALGIKVTDTAGMPIGFGRATGRHFGKILSTLIVLIGFIMAGVTERKQALHDLLAECLVVNRE